MVRITHIIGASKEAIWNKIIDHPGMPTWVGDIKQVEMVEPGSPQNELGAKRKIIFKNPLIMPIYEEVVMCNAPEEYHYVLYQGLPGLKRHFGCMKIDSLNPEECSLTWEIELIFKRFSFLNLVSGIFMKVFARNIERNVLELKRQLEAK